MAMTLTQRIVRLVCAGYSLAEVGRITGRSRQAVHARYSRLRKRGIPGIFPAPRTFFSTTTVALRLGVSLSVVDLACREGVVLTRRRGRERLFSEDAITALQAYLAKKREKICLNSTCRRSFTDTSRHMNERCCSIACRFERRQERMRVLMSGRPALESLKGWRRAVAEKLYQLRLPVQEPFLAFGDACALAGITRMQLQWLVATHIVLPEKGALVKGGKVCAGFSPTQMRAIRQAREALAAQKAKHHSAIPAA